MTLNNSGVVENGKNEKQVTLTKGGEDSMEETKTWEIDERNRGLL